MPGPEQEIRVRNPTVGHFGAMAHCVRAIVATSDIADKLIALYPQLPRVAARQGFAILPVDADFIDSGYRPDCCENML